MGQGVGSSPPHGVEVNFYDKNIATSFILSGNNIIAVADSVKGMEWVFCGSVTEVGTATI